VVVLWACAMVGAAQAAQVIYVDAGAGGAGNGSAWADAYPHLQDALATAAGAHKPVEIRVAQGIYKPDRGAGIAPGDQTATFQLLNGVTLKGGYAGAGGAEPNTRDTEHFRTTLSGDLAGDDGPGGTARKDNSFRVVIAGGTDATAVIDGFIIAAGAGLPTPPGRVPASGAAMLIDAASPTILNCCFTGNYGLLSGGVLLAANGSNPVVTDCTFLNNEGTALSNSDQSNAVLTNCRFEGNTKGGIGNHCSSPIVTGCLFTNNGQSGFSGQDCNSVLTGCVFEGRGTPNRERGIECGDRCSLSLRDCTFMGLGDGAINTLGDLDLMRCTFAANSRHSRSVVMCDGDLVARKCVFVDNKTSISTPWSPAAPGAIFGSDVELHDCEFTGNAGSPAGAVAARGRVFVATGCVFSGNSGRSGAGAILSTAGILFLSNCTFVGNRGRPATMDHASSGPMLRAELMQCIVRDGPYPFELRSSDPFRLTYSNVQGGFPREGNIDADPCFVDPGHWASADDLAKSVGPDDPCAVWVAGDYHLKSQGGHWDRAGATWVRDSVTSICIDAGDPNGPLGSEPFPNGGFVNMGAYGGTAEASKSYFGEPVCETQMAGDINGDCKIDQADMDILAAHWLMEGLAQATIPPTIAILSPADGAELTYPTPIILRSSISDPAGTPLWVMYKLEHIVGTGRILVYVSVSDPADNWAGECAWSSIQFDGVYAISAEVWDSRGIKAVSPRISVTLRGSK
jgi:hypothetical protein